MIRELRDRIWLYLSPSNSAEELSLEASALLQVTDADLLTLARVYFVVSEEIGNVLKVVPGLLRQLPTSSAFVEERSVERVRGAIQWPRTIMERYSAGMPHLYVTAPAQRDYQTFENQLLAFVLGAVASLGRETGWMGSRAGAGKIVDERATSSARWLSSRMLADVERQRPVPRSIAAVRSGRHRRRFLPVLKAFDLYQSLIAHLARRRLRTAIASYGLVIQTDGVLFEIYCLFEVLDALAELGWMEPHPRVFAGGLRWRCRQRGSVLDVWYQSTPEELSAISVYRRVLQRHGFVRPQDLRPDLSLRLTVNGRVRWLVIEAKSGDIATPGGRRVESNARASLVDLLGYLTAFDADTSDIASMVGLGIAWGRSCAQFETR